MVEVKFDQANFITTAKVSKQHNQRFKYADNTSIFNHRSDTLSTGNIQCAFL
uniref:Uncharacterized protein n=1 Tax=Ascaris lumbricoides TaxID=6252 RepID=A0A0M3ISA7_ASCLU